MISKEQFVEAINAMRRITDYQNDKNSLYKKYCADGFIIEPDNNDVIIKLIKLLIPEERFDVVKDFCFSKNYGRGKSNQIFFDEDGQGVIISSPEELYDYVVKAI